MARITISAAAKAGWASRPTIYRKIKAGQITLHHDGDRKLVDVADLERLFGATRRKEGPVPSPSNVEAVEVVKVEADLENARAEVTRLRSDLSAERHARDDDRSTAAKERDRLIGVIESQTLQIGDMRTEAKKGWLRRLFGV